MDSPETRFLGLAPFLRMSIAGTDILPIGQEMLAQAQQSPDDANLWMNLSTVMLCLGQRDLGLAIQAQALAMKRVYHLPALRQPAKLRLLMLMVPGDLSANTPLDCLLEDSDIDLDFYFVSPETPLASPIPEHDAVIVGISAADDSRDALTALESALAAWPKPIFNLPQHVPTTERNTASQLLQNVPGLLIPPTLRASRETLQAIATGEVRVAEQFAGCDFPLILRPEGSHGGRGLEKIDSAGDVSGYLSRVEGAAFFLAPFIDYSNEDGLFRKFRIALIEGVPYACHMAVSSHWMVHYVNADMYEDAARREEEAAFMAGFADFACRHRCALDAIAQRTGLDYVAVDCAVTRDNQFLVFEIDHAMVVHAMDPVELFPYKKIHMQKVRDAFRDFLLRRTNR
jgi:glutathione synthase/RimK-type ligase-like ATP-grasp enzyme